MLAKDKGESHCRDRGNDEIQNKTTGHCAFAECGCHLPEFFTELPTDCQNSPELNNDLKSLTLVVIEIE